MDLVASKTRVWILELNLGFYMRLKKKRELKFHAEIILYACCFQTWKTKFDWSKFSCFFPQKKKSYIGINNFHISQDKIEIKGPNV